MKHGENKKPDILVLIEIILLLASLLVLAIDEQHLAILLLGLSIYFKLM